jgi:hypothetical protein
LPLTLELFSLSSICKSGHHIYRKHLSLAGGKGTERAQREHKQPTLTTTINSNNTKQHKHH